MTLQNEISSSPMVDSQDDIASFAAVSSNLASHAPLPNSGAGIVDALLRERSHFLPRAQKACDSVAISRALIVTTVLSAGVFGVAVGLFRPGWQVVASGIKLPLLLLVTAALATPAMTGVRLALGQPARFRDDVLLVLATVALVSLGLAAFAPVMLLAVQWSASYHQVVLLAVVLCGLSGGGGLIYFLNNISNGGRFSPVLALVSLAVFSMVGTQLAWTLRPFVARPRAGFEWVRPLEGSFVDAVSGSLRSARGVYYRSEAPLPEEER